MNKTIELFLPFAMPALFVINVVVCTHFLYKNRAACEKANTYDTPKISFIAVFVTLILTTNGIVLVGIWFKPGADAWGEVLIFALLNFVVFIIYLCAIKSMRKKYQAKNHKTSPTVFY